LTAESTGEQAGAGLDQLSAEERAKFTSLNDAYRARFDFPFIMAVKGKSKNDILAAFERRLKHDKHEEFSTALAEIDTIAALRLKDILP
jgi:OHCU decarboxylase